MNPIKKTRMVEASRLPIAGESDTFAQQLPWQPRRLRHASVDRILSTDVLVGVTACNNLLSAIASLRLVGCVKAT